MSHSLSAPGQHHDFQLAGLLSGPVEILLIAVAIGYVLVSRMAGQPAQGKRMLLLPAILVFVGASQVSTDLTSALTIAFLVVTAGFSVVLGALRGMSVRLSSRSGLACVRYTWVTILLWTVNIGLKVGANVLLGALDPHDTAAASNSLLLTLGAGLLVEGLVVMARAVRANHRVLWEKGKDGKRDTVTPSLDDMRNNVRDRLGGSGTRFYPISGYESSVEDQDGRGTPTGEGRTWSDHRHR